jgi:hypothetical protein
VTSIRAVMLLVLCAAMAEAQTGDSSAAPPNDLFRRAPTVGSADTSTSGTDVFRRASVRREMASRGVDHSQDSVTIDGARVALDTVRASAVVSRDDITEHLARPVKNRPVVAAAPAPEPVTPPPPAVAAAPPPPPAAVVEMAPTVVEAPKPVVDDPKPAPPPTPAPVRTAVRPVPKPVSTPTVKAPPPTDSAQLVREVAELQRDVAPKLQSVGVALDSVRQQYQANLDRLQRESETLPDTLERKMLQKEIAAARWRDDTAAATTASANKKGKKAKAQSQTSN